MMKGMLWKLTRKWAWLVCMSASLGLVFNINLFDLSLDVHSPHGSVGAAVGVVGVVRVSGGLWCNLCNFF